MTIKTEKERLDRLELAIVQLTAGMKIGNGFRPAPESVLAEIVAEAQNGSLEHRPHQAPERRAG